MDYRTIALEKLAALPSFWSMVKYPNRLFSGEDGRTNVMQPMKVVQTGKTKPLINTYYSELLSNPQFQERLGGKQEASYLANVLSNTPVYVDHGTAAERKNGMTDNTPNNQYNPFTGNVSLSPYGWNPKLNKYVYSPKAMSEYYFDHENGHALYENSPAYSSRIKEIMAKHKIPYSIGYYPWSDSDEDYVNQPSEQAAELQTLRHRLNLMPGKGSGANGAYTKEEVQKAIDSGKYNIKPRRIFNGKPIEYITDLLNFAKNRKQTAYKPQTTMAG